MIALTLWLWVMGSAILIRSHSSLLEQIQNDEFGSGSLFQLVRIFQTKVVSIFGSFLVHDDLVNDKSLLNI
jgi:hypothetical protein